MLKKLKSLFIVEEENGNKTNNQNSKENDKIEMDPGPDSSEQLASIKEQATPLPKDAKPDSKFVNVLLKAINDNDLDGFDYLEYKQSLQSLSKMDMDESTRYQSAFAMAKTMGATPKKLIESAGHYIKVLNEEDRKFKAALQNQRSKQIIGREEKMKKLQLNIQEKKKAIAKLNQEIEKAQQSLGELKNSINQAAAKVELTNSQFQLAYQSVIGQINNDIQKMQSYLK